MCIRDSLKTLVTGAIKANARELSAAHVAPVCENLDFEVFTDEKWLEFILGQLIQNKMCIRDRPISVPRLRPMER